MIACHKSAVISMGNISKCVGFPYSSVGKESTCDTGDPGSIPGSARSPGKGIGYPLQYSCLENSMDRGAWRATVHELGEQIKMLELCFCLVIGDGM